MQVRDIELKRDHFYKVFIIIKNSRGAVTSQADYVFQFKNYIEKSDQLKGVIWVYEPKDIILNKDDIAGISHRGTDKTLVLPDGGLVRKGSSILCSNNYVCKVTRVNQFGEQLSVETDNGFTTVHFNYINRVLTAGQTEYLRQNSHYKFLK